MTLTWTKHPRIDFSSVARRRIWRARGTRYEVIESRCLYGREPARYYALCGRDNILGIHRKRSAAMKRCEHHARNGEEGTDGPLHDRADEPVKRKRKPSRPRGSDECTGAFVRRS